MPLFKIEAPEEPGAPFRLSASFADAKGRICLEVKENEWILSSGAWDAECTGGRIHIWADDGPYALILRAEPPDGIAVEKMQMQVKDALFEGDEKTLIVHREQEIIGFTGCIVDGVAVGLSL